MLKKAGIALVALLVLFVVVVLLQPGDFRVQRSTTIDAPAPVVFSMIEDFHAWDGWSPWAKLDPQMKKTFEGPEKGKGASYAWVGNKQVGEGRMEITDVRENSELTIQLHFITPFEATNTTVFTLTPKGANTTEVTWTMSGKNDFFGKAFGIFMNMDELIGGDFEKGLADLKRLSEEKAKAAPSP